LVAPSPDKVERGNAPRQKKGLLYVVVISPEEYERFRRAEEHDWTLVEQERTRTGDTDPHAVLAEVTAEVEAVRQER